MAWPTCREEERNIVHRFFGVTIESLLWLMGILFTAVLLFSGVLIYGVSGVLLSALLALIVYVPTMLIPAESHGLQLSWVCLAILSLSVLAYKNPYGMRNLALLIYAGVLMVALAVSVFLLVIAWPMIFQLEKSWTVWQPLWVLVLCYGLSVFMRFMQPLKTTIP